MAIQRVFAADQNYSLITTPPLTTPPSVPCGPVSVVGRTAAGELESDFYAQMVHSLPPIATQALDQYRFPAGRLSPLKMPQWMAARPLPSFSLSPDAGRPKKLRRVDMNMAQAGTMAARPGFQTPLANHVAQMVVWLWYGHFAPASSPTSSPFSESPSIPVDPFDPCTQPQRISQLMVQPSVEFGNFVARLLQVTMVSHSVTLVALLYIYRLKMKNSFTSTPGSEHRPFVAALMLGNKYLDDNTYTNATWAELAGISIKEINRMETEFLVGLNYELGVKVQEYTRWRVLLDAFMLSRGPGGSMGPGQAGYLFHSPLTAHPAFTPPTLSGSRARSASPPRGLPLEHHYVALGDSNGRKRSAVDAFYLDSVPPATSRQGPHLPNITIPAHSFSSQPLTPVHASRPALLSQDSTSSLARSASLNRQWARLPTHLNNTRRGSTGHVDPEPAPSQPAHYHQPKSIRYESIAPQKPGQWDGGWALLAPCGDTLPQPHLVPPKHLMFYSLAAEPHTGAGGQPRKAILHCQDPAPGQVMSSMFNSSQSAYQAPPPPPLAHPSEDGHLPEAGMYDHPNRGSDPSNNHFHTPGIYTSTPYTRNWSPVQGASEPEPAQFANAGPPGYVYNPQGSAWENGSRASDASSGGWVRTSDGAVHFMEASGRLGPTWTSRSEWSSPVSKIHY
nr:hypothetical protein L204_05719 [Cryptococcus depauperatus CBS 7855]